MRQVEFRLPSRSRGYHLVTREIIQQLPDLPQQGILNLFMKHTSAGLSINENADPTVRVDFESIMNYMVPENLPFIMHDMEGPDDMPAHIKSALVGVSLSIPIKNHRLNLGTWQGIYLCEFRNHAMSRTICATIYG